MNSPLHYSQGMGEQLKITVTARGVEVPDELKEFIHRRAHFGLGRFASRIRGVTVRLEDVNGPKGGLDKCCDIRVDAGLPTNVMVRERQENLHSAVSLAMERAQRALKRRLSLARLTDRSLPA